MFSFHPRSIARHDGSLSIGKNGSGRGGLIVSCTGWYGGSQRR